MSRISIWLTVAFFVAGCAVNVGAAIGQSWLTHHTWIMWLLWVLAALFLVFALREADWFRRYFWRVIPNLVPPLRPKEDSASLPSPEVSLGGVHGSSESVAVPPSPNVVFSHCRVGAISLEDPDDGVLISGAVIAEFFNDVSDPKDKAHDVVAHLEYFKRPDAGKPLGDALWVSRQGVWEPGRTGGCDFWMNERGLLLVGLIVREDNTKPRTMCAVGFHSADSMYPFGMETFELEKHLPVEVHVTLRGSGFKRNFRFIIERSHETYICEQLPTPA